MVDGGIVVTPSGGRRVGSTLEGHGAKYSCCTTERDKGTKARVMPG